MLKGLVTSHKGEVTKVKGEVANLKGEVANLKGEVINLKGEVAKVKGEVANLKREVTNLKGEVTNLKGEVANLKGEVINLKGEVANLKGEVAKVKGEVTNSIKKVTVYTLGPAATRRLPSSLSVKFSKLLINFSARLRALASHWAGSGHILRGFKIAESTPFTVLGIMNPKTGSFSYSTVSSELLRMASIMARVEGISMRRPTP